jgi:hypothetical protein
MKHFVYTNIGFEPTQYKILKHLAVERRLSVSGLIRESIEHYLRRSTISPSQWRKDYFFRLGTSSNRETQKPKQANLQDQVIRPVPRGSDH